MLKIDSVLFMRAARPQRAKMCPAHYISYMKTLAREGPSEERASASISTYYIPSSFITSRTSPFWIGICTPSTLGGLNAKITVILLTASQSARIISDTIILSCHPLDVITDDSQNGGHIKCQRPHD